MSRAFVAHAPYSQTVTITSGTTANPVSDAADIQRAEYIGILGATAFSSTVISLQVSPTSSSEGTWYDLYQANGSKVVVTVSTNEARAYAVDTTPNLLAPWSFVRIVSGSTGETTTRTLTIWAK